MGSAKGLPLPRPPPNPVSQTYKLPVGHNGLSSQENLEPENVGSEPVSQYLSGLQLSYRAAQQTYIDEGCIQKRRQKSSLFLGGQNCVNSLPR